MEISFMLFKGKVGDWINHFDEELNQKFDEVYAKKFSGTGLQHEFTLTE